MGENENACKVLVLAVEGKTQLGSSKRRSENYMQMYMWQIQIGPQWGTFICDISGFRREVHDNCFLTGSYAACSGDSLRTFRDNLSVPSSSAK